MISIEAHLQGLQATKTRRHEAGFVREGLLRAFVSSWPKVQQTALVLAAAGSVGIAAQQPPGLKTGNPTPGTEQPAPPNLADRVTLAGCVQAVGASPGASDTNSPSDARFVLANAVREGAVPPGTGTSNVAPDPGKGNYRLLALESQLAPFVGAKVEVSGEILPSTPTAGDGDKKTPTLQVEFVRKLAARCQ
jgi:hypothetical protein